MSSEELQKKIEELQIEIQYYKNIAIQAGNIRLRENEEFRKLILKNRETENELKSTNKVLQESLIQLKQAQQQLIESEKNAALSGLVAGVAHEINTPIGISITAASHIEDESVEFFNKVERGEVRKQDVEDFRDSTVSSTDMLLSNLRRAADLIKSFKQVAVDQIKDEKRTFNFKDYIQEVLKSLHPEYKRVVEEIKLSCSNDIEIYSYPGIFSQIITNFVMNSLIHGFENRNTGEICIDVLIDQSKLLFTYQDNGCGMDEKSLKRIFEPFYTTKRGKGGTGLGMHIVYNLVHQKLGGWIKCNSAAEEGTTINITIPLTHLQ